LNDTEETKVAGPSGPRISTGPAGRSLFSLTSQTVNILATGQRLRRPLQLVPITTNVVSLNPAYGKVYLVLYTTLCDKVCQVCVFFRVLRFPPPIKLTAAI